MKDILWLVIIASCSTSTGGAIARAFDPTTVPKTLVVAMFVICLLSCAVGMAMATFLEVFTTLGEERRLDHEAGLPPRSGRLRRHQPSAPTSPSEPRELATVPSA
ncbi:MAG: hypothetical protein ACRDZ2_05400 [Ilumatobacteraceae bacterium]